MPYLNWKTSTITTTLSPHASLTHQARLALSREQREELASELEKIFVAAGAELKLELPQKWTLYWHLRTGGTKLQLAHPQSDEWVATLYFTVEHGKSLIEKLRSGTSGETVELSHLGTLSWGSNFELVLDFA